jgi:hypothetical protein
MPEYNGEDATLDEQIRYVSAVVELNDFKRALHLEGFDNISVRFVSYDQYYGIPHVGWGELFFTAYFADTRLDASFYVDDGEEGDMLLADVFTRTGWNKITETFEYKSVQEFIDDFDTFRRVMKNDA